VSDPGEKSDPPRAEDAAVPDDDADRIPDPDEPSLTEYDKTLADSFPSSDPPSMP
jgi:hypothetical protein